MAKLHPETRREQILQAAIDCAEAPGGWGNFTREKVAAMAGCADSSVSKYFGTMTDFRRTIMREAIRTKNLSIIAQGLACHDKHAAKAQPELKEMALKSLAG